MNGRFRKFCETAKHKLYNAGNADCRKEINGTVKTVPYDEISEGSDGDEMSLLQ